MKRGVTRRALLGGLGGSAALAPFLPLLEAHGEEAQPLRLILWFTPHGTVYDNWKPSGGERDFTLSPILQPLEPYRSKITVLDGLKIQADGVGAPHTKGPPLLWTASSLKEDMTFTRADGSGGMYYGWNSGPSIDQVIAEQLRPTTPYRSLEFGVRSGGSHPGSRMIYTAAETPLAPETNPWAAFKRLIGDIGKTADELERIRSERRSVLDVLDGELGALRTKVSSADRHKIDAHLTAVRDIEQRLQGSSVSCQGPVLGDEVDANKASSTPLVMEAMSALMASSLSCGLTRFASMQYRVGENDGGYLYDWLGISDLEHHLMTHEPDTNAAAQGELTKIYTWYAQMFAKFLAHLDSVPEGNGTLLDNSLVVWGSELAKGNSHSFEKMPFVVAGGAAGKLQTGRYLQYDQVPHNRLLVSLAQLMGLPELTRFGGTDQGSGGLSGFA
ncbi:MAG: DUF1552 domain-containing protein [Myxococcales bacterium]|nr:MAG: DUF1552 domain-containing protein [Myxococcales bacterium]